MSCCFNRTKEPESPKLLDLSCKENPDDSPRLRAKVNVYATEIFFASYQDLRSFVDGNHQKCLGAIHIEEKFELADENKDPSWHVIVVTSNTNEGKIQLFTGLTSIYPCSFEKIIRAIKTGP